MKRATVTGQSIDQGDWVGSVEVEDSPSHLWHCYCDRVGQSAVAGPFVHLGGSG